MEIAFDPAKSERNLRERGISFEQADDFDFGTAIYFPDNRKPYGESRGQFLGFIEGRLHVLVFTMRGEILRVISLRKANRREAKVYEKATQS